MKRSQLRRRIERLALASLLGGAACGHPTPRGDLGAAISDGGADLACPSYDNGCYWLSYGDFGVPNGSVQYWRGDGGVDPCGPCRFETQPGVYCGQCEIVRNGCGTAYFCSILDCANSCNASGRRPAGLLDPAPADEGLGGWLARMAHLEAASVPAFVQLERELVAHGAPERLIAGARRARADEERHAAVVAGLARAHGARPLSLDVAPTPIRPLLQIALENAVEGCVRETAGAVLAAAQAPAFAEARVRRLFGDIAVDERRHANLAWAVDAWIAPRLGDSERALVEHARRMAIEELLVSARA